MLYAPTNTIAPMIIIVAASDNTFNLQVYKRLNHVGVCMSYSAVLQIGGEN